MGTKPTGEKRNKMSQKKRKEEERKMNLPE
jgi:hypothetical protein